MSSPQPNHPTSLGQPQRGFGGVNVRELLFQLHGLPSEANVVFEHEGALGIGGCSKVGAVTVRQWSEHLGEYVRSGQKLSEPHRVVSSVVLSTEVKS